MVAPAVPDWVRDSAGLRIAVLGADGFIGSHVALLAVAAGAGVTCLCVKDPWRLGPAAAELELVRIPGGRWWDEGLASELKGVLERVDALVLLAYQPPASREPEPWLRHELSVNAQGAGRVAEIARSAGTRVVFTSSADVYGPWHEAPVSEASEPDPATPYARAKLEAEQAILKPSAASPGAVCLRLATVYGPGEDGPRAIPSFIRALLRGEEPVIHGDGSDVRDYVQVRDVAGAIVNACAPAERLGGEAVLNIGSGVGRSTAEVLRGVASVVGTEPTARYVPSPRAPSRLVLDVDRARRALGLSPQASFELALDEEVGWLRNRLDNGWKA